MKVKICSLGVFFCIFICSLSTLSPDSPSASCTLGAYGKGKAPLGTYAKIVKASFGGSISGEYRMKAIEMLSLSGRIQANAAIPASSAIASYWNAAAFVGAGWHIPLASGFELVSEAS